MNSSKGESFGRERCGCLIRSRSAGGGWWLYEMQGCRTHRELPPRFWLAPCRCVAWSDGMRLTCARHAFLATLMPMTGGIQ